MVEDATGMFEEGLSIEVVDYWLCVCGIACEADRKSIVDHAWLRSEV